jgi:AcrR family transcriptional regulator
VSPRKPGRRPGDPDVTRRTILKAAREVFLETGFERATIRRIAAGADVDPGLVHHHFGTKASLFAAAHELPFDPDGLIEAVTDGPADELGERLARFYVEVVGAAGSPAVSLIRSAATNETAARMLREFIEDVLLAHAGRLAPGPNARLRVALAGSHMIGLVFARGLIGVGELRDTDDERLIAAVAPVLQHYLTAAKLSRSVG